MFFDIKKYAINDGPGIRTTVFLKGCPLRCKWCHNPESLKSTAELGLRMARCIGCGMCISSCDVEAIYVVDDHIFTDPSKCVQCDKCVDVCIAGAREIIGTKITVSDVMKVIKKDVTFYESSGGGVTVSGGEPLAQPDVLCDLLARCRYIDIHTAVDTTCYATREVIERVAGLADMFLCDIKHMDDEIHKEITGVSNKLILENTRWLAGAGKEIIIRLPFVPGFNDSDANIDAVGEFVASLPGVSKIEMLRYHSGGFEKAKRLTSEIEIVKALEVDPSKMEAAASRLESYGLKVKADIVL